MIHWRRGSQGSELRRITFLFMPRRSENLLIFGGAFEVPVEDQTSGRTLSAVSKLARRDKNGARLPGGLAAIIDRIVKAVVPCLVLGSSIISAAVLFVLIIVA